MPTGTTIGFPKKIPPPIDQSCVGYWKFDEASGNIKDWSGNGNTGIPYGSPTYGVAGKFGNAMQFDGVNDYIEITSSTSISPSSQISVETWIKPSSTPVRSYSRILQKGRTNGGSPGPWDAFVMICESNSNRTFTFVITTGTTPAEYSISDSSTWIVLSNTWIHITGVYNGSSLMIYVNGILKNTSSANGFINYGIPTNLRIGSQITDGNEVASYYTGIIDEVRIYNRALSTQEIKRHYMAGR